MISLDAARAAVLDAVTALEAVDVGLGDAAGLVLALDVFAGAPVPPFANSSMDGYALRAGDSGATLRVVGAVLAGDAPSRRVGAGEAARIMTGAPVPEGADAVCPVEVVEVLDGGAAVRVPRALSGDYVRAAGSDVAVGDELARAGDLLTPARLGALAAQGLATLRVVPRPVVGVVSTGDELAAGPGALAPGQIHDVNRPVLLAALAAAGYATRDLGAVGDDARDIAARLAEGASACDAVVSTGGVSVGDVDFVKTVLAEVCAGRAQWMQVAVRPGKPFAFGVAGATPLFGLAGNPVSTLASFELIVRPALARLAGRAPAPELLATLDVGLAREPDGRLHAVPVTVAAAGGGLRVVAAAPGASHQIGRVTGSNALALVPDGPGLNEGDAVEVVALSGAPWPA